MLKILIAVDGSGPSLNGVQHALALLRHGLRASLLLAHVQEPPTLYEYMTAVSARDPDMIAQAGRGAAEHLLEAARALLDAAGAPYETEVGVGDAAHTLLEMIESSGCHLVVVGARGQRGLLDARPESVAQQLVHNSPVPVTVVRHAALADGDDDADADGAAADGGDEPETTVDT